MSPTKKTPQDKTTEAPAKKGGGRRSATPRPDELTEDAIEFITAIDEYKRLNQRPFPSWSEVLEILKGLGYERR